MSIIVFNSPTIIAIPVTDLYGNSVTNASPVIVEGLQSFALSFKGSLQNLLADKQFALSGVRGDAQLEGKLTAVKQSAEAINALYSGQGYDSDTSFQQVYLNRTGPMYPNSPVNGVELYIGIPSTYPLEGIALAAGEEAGEPLGVYDAYGNAWGTRFNRGPGDGVPQGMWAYGGSHITGLGDLCYQFNCIDIYGTMTPPPSPTQIFVPYVGYTTTTTTVPANARHFKINNVQSGSSPVVRLIVAATFQGKKITLVLPRTVSSSFNMLSTKSLEFSGYDIDFQCYPDNTSDQTILEGFFLQ